MKYLKIMGLAAIAAAALMAFASSASATALYNSTTHNATTKLGVGASLKAEAESTVTLHPPIGDITCTSSVAEGTVSNAGGSGVNVEGSLSKLTFSGCNATVTVLKPGKLVAAFSSGTNAALTSKEAEVTVEFGGFHCIFNTGTTGTAIGTLTGSTATASTATFDISAKIPRTGGRSGAFCGSTAEWTGSYKVVTPDKLDATAS